MKRFIWNFEINPKNPFSWDKLTPTSTDDVRWESRFFWAEDEIVQLNGLDEQFLDLSRYEIKHREDAYYLLPDNDLNIKVRRDNLMYKPVIKKAPHGLAYGKKIKLEEQTPNTPVIEIPSLTIKDLLQSLQNAGKKIHVSKEALTYKIPITPSVKLEFARLTVLHKTYFSLSIESHESSWMEPISQHLLGKPVSCDYVKFLKRICPL